MPWQVEGEVAASVPGQAGGHGYQIPAERGTASPGMDGTGQAAGRTQQVVRDGSAGQPGGVRGEAAGGKVCERAVGQVGEDLLDDRVITMLLFGLDQVERAVGEHRSIVVPVPCPQGLHRRADLRSRVPWERDDQVRVRGAAAFAQALDRCGTDQVGAVVEYGVTARPPHAVRGALLRVQKGRPGYRLEGDTLARSASSRRSSASLGAAVSPRPPGRAAGPAATRAASRARCNRGRCCRARSSCRRPARSCSGRARSGRPCHRAGRPRRRSVCRCSRSALRS